MIDSPSASSFALGIALRCRENITNADNSDRVIQEKLSQNTEKLALLSLTACAEHLPKLEAGMVNTSDLEPQTILANLRSAGLHS